MSSSNTDPPRETRSTAVPTDDSTSPPEDTDAPVPVDLPLDQVFGLLTNQRRRRVLQILERQAEPLSIGDLAEQIAALENDKPVAQLDSQERKRVYVGLYQAHLPKMDALDVVEFNKPRGLVERGRNAHVLDSYLERAEAADEGETRPWLRYYANLSAVGAVVLGFSMWLQPQTTLPVTTIAATGVVAAFSGCSLGHYLSE